MAHLFLIGPGFIGGTVLTRILDNKDAIGVETISVLTRRDEQAKTLEKLGVQPVRGTLDDTQVITDEVIKSDIVIHSATADHFPSAQAVLTGLGKRAAAGQKTVYLHTSGAAVLDDGSAGLKAGTKWYSDEHIEDIDALPSTAPHRNIDLAIVKAMEEFRTQKQTIGIVMPPTIYGVGTGPFNNKSIQAPMLIEAALKAKQSLGVGEGKNKWTSVHVQDLADGYLLILKHLVGLESPAPEPYNPYFFISSDETFAWGELYDAIGSQLAAKSLIDSSSVKYNADAELQKIWGFPEGDKGLHGVREVFGCNSLSKADRLKGLGWKPKAAKGNKERPLFIESVQTDIEEVLKAQKA